MDVSDFDSFEAVESKDLPTEDAIRASIKKVGEHVEALLKAHTAEPFVGPAIFSGRASGVFFHEIFGHRIEGHRQKDEAEVDHRQRRHQDSARFSVQTFDPTSRKIGNVDLNGWYEYDDEGVAGRPVKAVDKRYSEELPDVAVAH